MCSVENNLIPMTMRYICIYILLLMSFTAHAYDCFDFAGRDYHIDPDLIRAITWKESHYHVGAIGKNPGVGHGDGLMQIDSQNLPDLSQYGITEEILLHDGCMNIYTGAYYLALAFHRWGVNWDAVGAYNAGFARTAVQDARRKKYATDVHRIYMGIKATKTSPH